VSAAVRVGVVTFPGSLDDADALRAVRLSGLEPVPLWHASDSLHGVDAVLLPGGFSYGDYLRCGAIARFSPVMGQVKAAAQKGMPVLGICNGFQVLCEAHLLEGALIRNDRRTFICKDQLLQVESSKTAWTNAFTQGQQLNIVVKHGEGNYQADRETVARLEGEGRVVFRYMGSNPNGSVNDIAGITNERGNVVGLMPHPEHNVDPLVTDSLDGRMFFRSVLTFLRAAQTAG
jgi:phosphoribosylformylglycinamidine synthase